MGSRRDVFHKDGRVETFDTREVEEEKEKMLKMLKDRMQEKLMESDWYVIRMNERKIEIPEKIKKFRETVLSKMAEIEEEFKKIDNLEKYDKYYEPGKLFKLLS